MKLTGFLFYSKVGKWYASVLLTRQISGGSIPSLGAKKCTGDTLASGAREVTVGVSPARWWNCDNQNVAQMAERTVRGGEAGGS